MSMYFVNWRLLKSQAPVTSEPVQSKASFKASSKHDKLQRQLRLLQALSSHVFNTSRDGNPPTFQPCAVRSLHCEEFLFSISSEFPSIHPHYFTSRTKLHHLSPPFRQVTALCPLSTLNLLQAAQMQLSKAPLVHHRLHPLTDSGVLH